METGFGSFLGPIDLEGSGIFGVADLEPKLRLLLRQEGPDRRMSLAGYHELQAVDPRVRPLGLGNSLHAFLFGRDEGEYFLATGAEFVLSPPSTRRELWRLRLYGEDQEAVEVNTDVAVEHSFDSDWRFRSNIQARELEEVGAELHLRPWWGEDPAGAQFGLDLFGHAAAWRSTSGEEGVESDYLRGRAVARMALPLGGPRWRLGVEAGGGAATGELPIQRRWFLGGPLTLRGYDASVRNGTHFVRGRVELSRRSGSTALALFGDTGWAGEAGELSESDLLYAVGVGASFLDGLVRLDLSRGLRGPERRTRLDLHLDAIL